MALISTKSPTVLVPLRMPEMHIAMTSVRPMVKMTPCPEFSTARDT